MRALSLALCVYTHICQIIEVLLHSETMSYRLSTELNYHPRYVPLEFFFLHLLPLFSNINEYFENSFQNSKLVSNFVFFLLKIVNIFLINLKINRKIRFFFFLNQDPIIMMIIFSFLKFFKSQRIEGIK